VLPEPSAFTVFLVAALTLLIIPGPAVLYIVARSVDQGRRAGLVSVLGIGIGSMVHVTAAALGLSSLLVRSATAFSVVKYLGAAYLIYLGVRRFMNRDGLVEAPGRSPRSMRRVFSQGIWVNVLNPKTALFFFAFLPQFVSIDRGSVGAQILLLGTIFVAMGIISDSLYAVAAGSLGDWLRERPRVMEAQRWFAGTVFVSLGVATALSGSRE
jgi:threonine/homoserine/homoserine lactone efflux protein